ncbi:Hypothetical protein CINCED_3A006358 [Cinara cedri]|uniref:Uncharacterized protein n=1 Tax=Cinara cedri TaxID=506608 RepID=A0A5E4NTA6_9HEMI|nr:Hypothetical protein CINCED_3A006358 [Cinara cedri]
MKEVREEKLNISEVNKNLSKEVNRLKLKIDDIRQKSHEKMAKMSGIPNFKDKDCAKIYEEIGFKLNVIIQVEKAAKFLQKTVFKNTCMVKS